MKKLLFLLVAAFGLLVTIHTASAQSTAPVPPAAAPVHHANVSGRIRQGVASGELTRAEAARLRARQAGTRQDKQAARADGVVTRDERQDLRQDHRQTSQAIYRQKHDGQERRRAR